MKKLLALLLTFTFIIAGCSKNTKEELDSSLVEEQDSLYQTTYVEKPTIGRPKSQEPITNIFIALNHLKQSSSYESSSTGKIIAKKGSLKLANQTLENRKLLTSTATFSESISISSFVKIAEQRYITDESVQKREASKVSSSSVKWSQSTKKMSNDEYLDMYGFSYKDPSRYVINEQTILGDIEILNNGIGRKFTYKFNLDPKIASHFYKLSVKTMSNSSTMPEFKSIEMTMTFDYKWRMTKIEVNEVYKITLSALGEVTCYANLTETFKNVDKSVSIPEKSFFESKL